MKNLFVVLALSLPLTATAQPPVPSVGTTRMRERRYSVDYQNFPLESALVQIFKEEKAAFIFASPLATRVTLQQSDQSLEALLKHLVQPPLTLSREQGIWRVHPGKASPVPTERIAVQLTDTPLDTALDALRGYLPHQKVTLTSLVPLPKVSYFRSAISPQQALFDILRLAEPAVALHIKGDGVLELRLRTAGETSGEPLDMDFRNASLRDAVHAIARQGKLESIVILPGLEKAKLTLSLTNTTPLDALRQLCAKCEPSATLVESEGIYYIRPKK